MKDQIIAPENVGRYEVEAYDGILNVYLSSPADVVEINYPSDPPRASQIRFFSEANIFNISHTGQDLDLKFDSIVAGYNISYVWCSVGKMYMHTGINYQAPKPVLQTLLPEDKPSLLHRIKSAIGFK